MRSIFQICMHNSIAMFVVTLVSYGSLAAQIGYGFSDAVLPAKNQELFYMGFEAGAGEVLGTSNLKNAISLVRITDGSQLGAVKSAKQLLAIKEVVMMAGFPTSHEALLVAPLFIENGILSFFAGAGHSSLANFGEIINTTGESMSLSVDTTLNYIKNIYFEKNGLVISNAKAVFSKNQEDSLKSKITKTSLSSKIQFANLNSNLKLESNILTALKEGHFNYLILTPYADESVHLLEQLEKSGIDIPIITNSSWTTGDVEYIRRFLSRRKSSVVSTMLWSKKSKDWKLFERKIMKLYGRTPTSEMAYGYDVGIISATLIKKTKPPVTKVSVAKTFSKVKCFEGTSVGRLCFDNNGGHALRKMHLVRFTINGYEEL